MTAIKTFVGCVLATAAIANAHLTANSLVPQGGETLKVGDQVTITWKVGTSHDEGIDIALSKNNGTNWTDIKTAFQDKVDGAASFKWTIPADAQSSQAKLRICQSAPCNDTPEHGLSNPGGKAPWRLVSNTFVIQGTSALAAPSASEALAVDFNPANRTVDVSFALNAPGKATLQAFTLEGRLVATLLDGRYEPGSHKLSVFANSLKSAQGLVLKLNVAGITRSHTWLALH
jgi:hypothetical protein